MLQLLLLCFEHTLSKNEVTTLTRALFLVRTLSVINIYSLPTTKNMGITELK